MCSSNSSRYFLMNAAARIAAAGNHAFELSIVRNPAAIFIEKFFEGVTHVQLIDAGLADMAAHAEELRPLALLRADGGVRVSAVLDNPWERGQGLDVVDDRR